MSPYICIVPVILLFEFTLAQNVPLRGPPQFETNPQYLDSYIPASMQVIAYLTEMMKYDIKPTVTSTTRRPTTTTPPPRNPPNRPIAIQPTTNRPLFTAPPPTPYHKPALYAPYHPPGFIIARNDSPVADEPSNVDSYEEYVNRLKIPLADYFDRYRQVESISSIIDQLNRQRRANPFHYVTVTTKESARNDVPSARRLSGSSNESVLLRKKRANPFIPVKVDPDPVQLISGQTFNSAACNCGQRTPRTQDPHRSRSVRGVTEDIDESSNQILQRKIRANPFTPIKADLNAVRQNSGQRIDSIARNRGQPAQRTPELTRSRSVRRVTEDIDESSNTILQRKIRANPFTPIKADLNAVRQNSGQRIDSITRNHAQSAQRTPELTRSRSVRSVAEEIQINDDSDTINHGEVLSYGDLNSPLEDMSVGKVPLIITKTPLELTVSSDSNKAKGRALSINGDNFNARSVDYLGFGLNELIKEIQAERENVENRLTDDDRVKLFSTKYDDGNFASYLLRQKKIPPTKAYVTLLSLYDLLNKESKKLMLNKYNGYATAIVEELVETSSGTSSEQLRIILQRILDRPDTNDATIRSKITSLVTDLSTSNSYINDALRYIPPLPISR